MDESEKVVRLRRALNYALNALQNARAGAATGSPFSTHAFDLSIQAVLDTAGPENPLLDPDAPAGNPKRDNPDGSHP